VALANNPNSLFLIDLGSWHWNSIAAQQVGYLMQFFHRLATVITARRGYGGVEHDIRAKSYLIGHEFGRPSELIATKLCVNEMYKLAALGSFFDEL